MGMTFRQVIIGSIPTVVAILGFLWFRRKKKDPAICWKEEDKEPVATKSETAQRQPKANGSVHRREVPSRVAEEPIFVSQVQATPLTLTKEELTTSEKTPVCDKVEEISKLETSLLESQIIPQQIAYNPAPEANQIKVEAQIHSASGESAQTAARDEGLHLSNGVEVDEIQPQVATTTSSCPKLEKAVAQQQFSANTTECASNQEIKLPTEAEQVSQAVPLTKLQWDSVPDESSNGVATEDKLHKDAGAGDENANLAKKATEADYSHTNGHAMVNGHEESERADAGDHVSSKGTSSTKAEGTDTTKTNHPSGDCDHNGDGTDAQSEVSSDSGRGASGIETPTATSPSELSDLTVYEFDFPTDYCGRLIGRAGKNINSLKSKTGAEIVLKRKPFVRDYQTCSIEGTQSMVQAALEHIRRRFPAKHFPMINYKQTNVLEENPTLAPEIMQLSLPEGVSVDVVVSSVVSANHIFIQQPTHPTFSSLESLNYCMNVCYTQDNVVPQLPRPIDHGVICAAPVFAGWYRAQVVAFYPDTDMCDIKYVDYGGYMRVEASSLKQIRSDFATLPFQAVECYLANVMPLEDGEDFGVEASVVLENLVQGQMLQAQIVDHEADGVPYIQIYNITSTQTVFVNRELVEAGVARWMETQG